MGIDEIAKLKKGKTVEHQKLLYKQMTHLHGH
jgi:hypothetical protein